MEGHWPWWAGAGALAFVTVAFAVFLRRPFGVSGVLARVLDPTGTMRDDKTRSAFDDAEKLQKALAKATAAHFGEGALETRGTPLQHPPPVAQRDPWLAQVLFIGSIAVGAAAAAVARGTFGESTFEGVFAHLFGHGITGIVTLIAGGILVGFGTQMSTGCTSGHGLSGCSRAQPGSLLATCAFFGTGVVVSLLLAWGLG